MSDSVSQSINRSIYPSIKKLPSCPFLWWWWWCFAFAFCFLWPPSDFFECDLCLPSFFTFDPDAAFSAVLVIDFVSAADFLEVTDWVSDLSSLSSVIPVFEIWPWSPSLEASSAWISIFGFACENLYDKKDLDIEIKQIPWDSKVCRSIFVRDRVCTNKFKLITAQWLSDILLHFQYCQKMLSHSWRLLLTCGAVTSSSLSSDSSELLSSFLVGSPNKSSSESDSSSLSELSGTCNAKGW